MYKPDLLSSLNLTPISVKKYERYLPTAFDESLSMTEKINMVIHYLHDYSKLTDEMLLKWNEVYNWIMNEGLDEMVGDRLSEWLKDGTFYRIINEEIFSELNNKIDNVVKDFDSFKNDITNQFSIISKELTEMIDKLSQEIRNEVYNIGTTQFIRR